MQSTDAGEMARWRKLTLRRRPTFWQRLWLLLPAFASVTLLATTNHVCTDVAVMPMLWVVPLALYLAHVHHCVRSSALVSAGVAAGLTLMAIYIVALVLLQGLGAINLLRLRLRSAEGCDGWRKSSYQWLAGSFAAV